MPTHSIAGPGSFCERCGTVRDHRSHEGCARALELEPPRYCRHCARRMVVQVMPAGWRAQCVEHGTCAATDPTYP